MSERDEFAEFYGLDPDTLPPRLADARIERPMSTTACNARPPEGHPFHGTMIACHMAAGHDGPHTWDHKPSMARLGLNRLLALMPTRELESFDSQLPHELEVFEVDEHGRRSAEPYRRWGPPGGMAAGPWVLVRFVGGDEYAIWKHTGNVYRVGPDGAVEEDPMLTLDDPGGLSPQERTELRRTPRPES